MQGIFDITCVSCSDGSTAIGHQSITAPWHLSKPYWDGQVLLVQAVNATAGIFAGDDLDFTVTVEAGASVLLTSPSASRIHTMHGGQANLRQVIRVAGSAWLEWMPELFIPQAQCRYRQQTQVEVESGGGLFMMETLAPGRVAHGESFAFEQLDWSTRIVYQDELVLAERYPMSPRDSSLAHLNRPEAAYYFASALFIHPAPLPWREWQSTILSWNTPEQRMGGTQLADHVYLFRIVAASSEKLRQRARALRSLLSQTILPLRQSARKL